MKNSNLGKGSGILSNFTKNVSITQHGPHNNEKTTEGILKAARLGDLKMLAELHREGLFLSPSKIPNIFSICCNYSFMH